MFKTRRKREENTEDEPQEWDPIPVLSWPGRIYHEWHQHLQRAHGQRQTFLKQLERFCHPLQLSRWQQQLFLQLRTFNGISLRIDPNGVERESTHPWWSRQQQYWRLSHWHHWRRGWLQVLHTCEHGHVQCQRQRQWWLLSAHRSVQRGMIDRWKEVSSQLQAYPSGFLGTINAKH